MVSYFNLQFAVLLSVEHEISERHFYGLPRYDFASEVKPGPTTAKRTLQLVQHRAIF